MDHVRFSTMDDKLVEGAFAWARILVADEPKREYSCPTRDVFAGRMDRCRSDAVNMGMSLDQSYLLHAIVGEIGNNAFDHNIGAWRDVPGILFGWNCTQSACVVVIADRGQGVLKTLQQVRPELHTDAEALRTAFLERLSGRSPERRGNGLKFVRGILLEDGLDLLFQSGDAQYAVAKRRERWSAVAQAVPGCVAVVSWKKL